jgi:RNA polymerase sigma-70 factor (sigma-E family)
MEPSSRTEGGRLGELYLRHADDAVRLAYLITGDRHLAEDLVQDAFIRMAGRLVHLRDPDAFEAYLRRTVVNLANSHFRHRKVERGYVERQQRLPAIEGVEHDLDTREDLWRRLQRLTQRQRAAIVLRVYEDLSEPRVAEIMGCRVGTVKSLVSRGLALLRADLQAGAGDPRFDEAGSE